MWSATSEKYLFGGPIPWDTQSFHAVDDRVGGGCSHSTLAPRRPKHTGDSHKDGNIAHFSGTLDTTTLGGAGFASQQTHGDLHWDLSDYDGIVLKVRPGGGARSAIGEGEVKKYTLLLKDSILEKRPDGRERSAVCWEVDFRTERPAHSEGATIRHYFKWSDFRATYRGRDCPDDERKRLDIAVIKRVGFMVRSFFKEQSGDFSLDIESVAAYRKGEEYPYRDEPRYTSMGYKLGDETPKSALNEKMPTRKRVQEMRYRDSPEDDTRTGDDGFVEDLRVTYLDPAESWSSWRYYLCGCI